MKPATPQAAESQLPAGWTIQEGAGGWRVINKGRKWETIVYCDDVEKGPGLPRAIEAAIDLERRALAEIEQRRAQAQSLREAFRPSGGTESMRTITLTQPWATLIAIGAKRIETRSWATSYRGPLAIHAAKGLGPLGGNGLNRLAHLCFVEPFHSVLTQVYGDLSAEELRDLLPLGAIVAVCDLVDCVSTDLFSSVQRGTEIWQVPPGNMSREYSFGDYSPGRFAWLLSNIRALPEPIPAKGALGLWDCDLPQLTDATAAREVR
jgi:activating signal cointegrator 1